MNDINYAIKSVGNKADQMEERINDFNYSDIEK